MVEILEESMTEKENLTTTTTTATQGPPQFIPKLKGKKVVIRLVSGGNLSPVFWKDTIPMRSSSIRQKGSYWSSRRHSHNRGNNQIACRYISRMTMKLKVKITGPKVHDVGYRPYLTELAMRLALRGFEVYNDEEDGRQLVVALVESDEQRIEKFYNSAMKERPQLANVDNVKSEDFADDVMPLWQFASINTASQMNKAIPLLLATKDNTDKIPQIGDDLKAVRKNTEATLEEIKGLREDIQPGYATNFRQVQADVRAIKERLGMQ
jgi:acylphosphatase